MPTYMFSQYSPIQVIILMSVQYFIVYSLLQILQTYNQMRTPGIKGEWERIFTEAALEVDFGPMLGVLFLAIRMRAQQLWPPDGKVPPWAQSWMWITSIGVLLATAAAILQPWLSGTASGAKEQEQQALIAGGARKKQSQGAHYMGLVFGIMKMVSLFFIYVGAVVVIFALFELPAPPGSSTCSTC